MQGTSRDSTPDDENLPREWTVRDIPRAVNLAFDLEKLATGAAGLTLACLTYGSFYWLGEMTGEKSAHRVFLVLGSILAVCLCTLASGLIARMSTTQLLEKRRITTAELRRFARQRWRTLLGIPLAFGAIALTLLGVEAMLALVGAIPGIGPIVYSACFLVAFALSLTAALVAAVHMVGAFLYPTIIAIRGVGALGATLEVIEACRRNPLQVILYEAIVAAVGGLMTLLIGVAVWGGVNMTLWLGGAIMGDKFDQSLSAVPEFFRVFLRPFTRLLPLGEAEFDLAWHYDLSGILLGASLMMIVVSTLVYPFVFFTTAGSITYLILRGEPLPEERSPIEEL